MADPDTQSPEVIAHLGRDIPDAIVASRAPALLQLDDAGREIEVVVSDQDGVDRILLEIRDTLSGTAAAVHEGRGLQQHTSVPAICTFASSPW